MKTKQPKWKCVAQLGDANPIDYGGYWVFIDTTGVYPPEAELYEANDNETGGTCYRWILEPCTYINGILSDNKFHPDHPVWFADKLQAICDSLDGTVEELIEHFTSDDPIKRALAWRSVADYFGPHELDSYPLTLTEKEAQKRYKLKKYRPKETP